MKETSSKMESGGQKWELSCLSLVVTTPMGKDVPFTTSRRSPFYYSSLRTPDTAISSANKKTPQLSQ